MHIFYKTLPLFFLFLFTYSTVLAQDEEGFEFEHKLIGSGASRDGIKYEKYQKRKVQKAKDPNDRDIYISPVYTQDGDGDGVTGPKDKCPDTPKEITVCVSGEDSITVRTSPLYYMVIVRDGGFRDTLDYTYVNAEGCLPDSDGDGIPDYQDVCPEVPGKIEKRGCPENDDDQDGVPNQEDECPQDKGTPQTKGCPDFDRDGVPDKTDECISMAGPEHLKGCPDRDYDNIPDKDDLCPDVPGIEKLKGCPDKPDETDLKVIDAASRVKFEPNSATIDPSNAYVLDEFYTLLVTKFPNALIELIGHTDDRPLPDGYGDNQTLSENRAAAVKDYLISKGIAPERFQTSGKGFSEPIDTNETAEGRANNRRVEIKVVPQE